jgi:hypothetical protein
LEIALAVALAGLGGLAEGSGANLILLKNPGSAKTTLHKRLKIKG